MMHANVVGTKRHAALAIKFVMRASGESAAELNKIPREIFQLTAAGVIDAECLAIPELRHGLSDDAGHGSPALEAATTTLLAADSADIIGRAAVAKVTSSSRCSTHAGVDEQ